MVPCALVGYNLQIICRRDFKLFGIFTATKTLCSGLLLLRALLDVDDVGRDLQPPFRVAVHRPREDHLRRRKEAASGGQERHYEQLAADGRRGYEGFVRIHQSCLSTDSRRLNVLLFWSFFVRFKFLH